jgi:nucleotide-binding universal stress UspA family protein
MVEIQRILCPIDFSDASRHALEHATALAKWYGSQVTALHVIHPAILLEPSVLLNEPGDAAGSDADRAAIDAQLRDWLKSVNEMGLRTDILVEEGNPASRILERARSLPADLIVTGTHGRGGFDRFMLGSVSEKVLRKAACPVLTVPPPAATVARVPYARLLCPVDFSDASLAALQFAFAVAKESDARLTIMHVLDWPPDDELLTEQFDSPEVRRLLEERVRGRLDALVTDDVRTWCKPSTTLSYGKPYARILESAEREGSDLIVIGVRGRNAFDLTLFGSTTNQVVRRASCPVLTVIQTRASVSGETVV